MYKKTSGKLSVALTAEGFPCNGCQLSGYTRSCAFILVTAPPLMFVLTSFVQLNSDTHPAKLNQAEKEKLPGYQRWNNNQEF